MKIILLYQIFKSLKGLNTFIEIKIGYLEQYPDADGVFVCIDI